VNLNNSTVLSSKLFVERTLPMMDPLKEAPEAGGVPHRFEKMPRVVVFSVAGYWDQAMFEALSLTWRLCLGGDLIAEIYRHSSEFLTLPEFQTQARAVLDAVAQAGEGVVRQGKVNPDTLPPYPASGPPGHPGAPVPGILAAGAGSRLLMGRSGPAGRPFFYWGLAAQFLVEPDIGGVIKYSPPLRNFEGPDVGGIFAAATTAEAGLLYTPQEVDLACIQSHRRSEETLRAVDVGLPGAGSS